MKHLESIIAGSPYLDSERFLLLSSLDSLNIFYPANWKDPGLILCQVGSLNYCTKHPALRNHMFIKILGFVSEQLFAYITKVLTDILL